jgi:glycosyltransferase involved in cell wall biosynthesis
VRYLFVHQNFPGQYKHLALHLARTGHAVAAIGEKANLLRQRRALPGMQLMGYEVPAPRREDPAEGADADILACMRRGRAAAAAALTLRSEGFRPDVVFAHPGWGEATFLKDVFPAAKLILYCEFFYRAQGADVGFDAEFPARPETLLGLRVRNAPFLMALDACDLGIAPTSWQRLQFPPRFWPQMRVMHDGIDTDLVTPNANACFAASGSDVVLTARDEVVTYVARNLEPYRGFHSFMRAIPEIQRRRPKARIVVVGGDEVSYSPRPPHGQTYRQRLLRELGSAIDASRLIMLGRIPYADYVALLRISSAHVYLTYPFVLSWSLLEAMSAGAPVIASRTPPVEEVVTHGENGLLADFFSSADIATQVEVVLTEAKLAREMRDRARRTVVERYDLRRVCLPNQLALVDELSSTSVAA